MVESLRPFYIVTVSGKRGERLFIYIPRDVVRLFNIEPGDLAEIKVNEREGKIVVKFLKPRELGVNE